MLLLLLFFHSLNTQLVGTAGNSQQEAIPSGIQETKCPGEILNVTPSGSTLGN